MRVDCHIHMVLDGNDWRAALGRHEKAPDKAFLRGTLEQYRQAGYGYLRDGGDRWGVGAVVRKLAPEYGISYRTPLCPLYKKGHYGSFIGKGFSDMREFAALARENRAGGADFLKIMISGLMDFSRPGVLTEDGLSPAEIREMVHIGKDLGMAVMAHGNGARAVEAAAEAGVDSIEHGAYLHRDSLQAMVQAGVVWVPTLSAVGNLLGKGRFPEKSVEAILNGALENVSAFAQMDGIIACGSDAGAWAVPHGGNTEMVWLEKALGDRTESVVRRGNTAIMERF